MGMPTGLPIVDTMIGFPHEGFEQYDFIRKQTKDRNSKEEMEFPAEYMFKDVPEGPARPTTRSRSPCTRWISTGSRSA